MDLFPSPSPETNGALLSSVSQCFRAFLPSCSRMELINTFRLSSSSGVSLGGSTLARWNVGGFGATAMRFPAIVNILSQRFRTGPH